MEAISKSTLNYLQELTQNNNRDWFAENKETYSEELEKMTQFADSLLTKLRKHDTIETLNGKKSLYRIYRDVRFSKDKAPYKKHWAGSFKRATDQKRGGYYYHIEPGNKSFIAGGFWSPSKEDLLRIREEIAMDAEELRTIINAKEFVETFGQLQGEQLKTAPKGFPKDHENIDLLRYKQFIFWKPFTDKEIISANFAEEADKTFKAMRPFFDYFSDVLTTDINGTPL